MKLGFAVKALGRPGLHSHDSRRWQHAPHLSISLAYLRDMFIFLGDARIGMYRMSPDLAPYVTHPDLPHFHDQIVECSRELRALGELGRRLDLRLSIHPGQHVILNSEDDALTTRSAAELNALAALLDAMYLDRDAVCIIHLGGVYENPRLARERLVERLQALPQATLRRLAVEPDDGRFAVPDALWLHERTGLPVIFDLLHHRLNNPTGLSVRDALTACLTTWPPGVRPKIHFSSPRTEWVVSPQSGIAPTVHQPRWSHHADFAHPFEFIDFMRQTEGLPEFDVMLELKAKDLALRQLLRDLQRFAPDLAARIEPPPALATHRTTRGAPDDS
jgi:UV DNA damage endonuclease